MAFQNLPTGASSPAERARERLKSLLAHERTLPLPQSDDLPFSLKGSEDGLILSFKDAAWDTIISALAAHLSRPVAHAFFQGATVRLKIGEKKIDEKELEELVALLEHNGISVEMAPGLPAVRKESSLIRPLVQSSPSEKPSERSLPIIPDRPLAPLEELPGMVLRRPLHSGEIVRNLKTIVILGDVPSACQIISDGDVIVFGKLRGLAHAGAAGDLTRFIAALVLTPSGLRIGTLSAAHLNPSDVRHDIGELALVRDGRIVVEPWLKWD